MTDALFHRGPDDAGIWVDPVTGAGLGFRRLAILDLSPEGHQPMISIDDAFVLVFNGEIYNFMDLRRELEDLGHSFRGHSDTEVILAGFLSWGIQETIARCQGMFAMAVWDRRKKLMHLYRDRLGKKPLYYGWQGNAFLFGSELKALRVHPSFEGEMDRDAIGLFFQFSCVPGGHSIFKGIRKLPPGHGLVVDPSRPRIEMEPRPYWRIEEVVEEAVGNRFGSEVEALEVLESLLMDATTKRMIADVPVGAFLSGGIDSSLVVALMQTQHSRPVKTFTIGFREDQFNEAHHAREVSRCLGTEHTEVFLSGEEALSVVPTLPSLYDEPFADSSQIPTLLVSQLARSHVTVALSGDGGDEIFGGYSQYGRWPSKWNQLAKVPFAIRRSVAEFIRARDIGTWNRTLRGVGRVLPALGGRLDGSRLHRLAEVVDFSSFPDFYGRISTHWSGPGLVLGSMPVATPFADFPERLEDLPLIEKMMFLDTLTYLPDDILVKVDRASMATSLEVRAPLLDYRVLACAWRFRPEWKHAQGVGKRPLRRILQRYVPESLIDRPKQGFGVPLVDWLKGPLRSWAEDLLSPDRIKSEGYLRPGPILLKWEEHKAGVRDWSAHLWDVLMFQAWLEFHRKQGVSND